MEENELLVINPHLYSDRDKYIWINDSFQEHNAAQKLFDYLLKKNIYIKGFASNAESMVSLRMYNKEIYDIAVLDEEYSEVFYDPYFDWWDLDISDKVSKARVINPNMDGEYCAVWGCGVKGEHVYKILADNGMQIECFIDTNKKSDVLDKHGIPIYAPDECGKIKDDIVVIESQQGWETLDKSFQEKYKNRFRYSMEYDEINREITCNNDGETVGIFCLGAFWMFNHFIGKKIYIYGIGPVEMEFVKYLKLLDYDFAGFLIDEDDTDKEVGEGCPVKYVEEILYEENWYIWAYSQRRSKRLNNLGLKYFTDYYIRDYRFDVNINSRNILDINLGHTYVSDSEYSGFSVYGDEKQGDFKIAVLGGSTTDGTMYPFKSWPELLYEELGKEKVTIYNGGVCSYTSGQELIKLFRDVLQLNPEMIIVYDGYNDLAFSTDTKYPFSSLYLEEVFEYASVHIEEDKLYPAGDFRICKGIASQQGYFGNWQSNIRTMYAIANERNISFFSFCQPVLNSKKTKTIREKNILLSILSDKAELFRRESFRRYMEQMIDRPEYMYDLSHIFDEENDVYMDICHVWENGNRIIAKEIKKVIVQDLKYKY